MGHEVRTALLMPHEWRFASDPGRCPTWLNLGRTRQGLLIRMSASCSTPSAYSRVSVSFCPVFLLYGGG